jgi:excisionase family DNA binding protein
MKTNAPGSDRLLSVYEAASELGVHPVTIHRWRREGLIPSIQPGGPGHTVRISERALLQEHRQSTKETHQ